jgi:pimeloyl-ACP methyl ester carboxylesterase
MTLALPSRLAALAAVALAAAAPGLRAQWRTANGGFGAPLNFHSRPPEGTEIQPAYKPSEVNRLVSLLRLPRINDAELAPDGRHVAYVANDADRLSIVLIDVDHPDVPVSIEIGASDWWHRFTGTSLTLPQVGFMRWANARRLVFAEATTGIFAVSADGKGLTKLVTAADVAEAKTDYLPGQPGYEPPGLIDQAVTTDLVPRIPRIVALPPDDPGHVIVEAQGALNIQTGLYSYGLYRVDVETGAHASLGEAELPGHQLLYDRSGHLRIVLGALTRSYLHALPGNSVWRGATLLDKTARDPADRGFAAKPPTYFGSRSVPVGFDRDPNVLYYASNRGRDTVGLFALNVRTGIRTGFALEDAGRDLLAADSTQDLPVPGAIADPLVFDPASGQLAGVRLAGPGPATRWLDPTLAQIERRIGEKFFPAEATLWQWDVGRTRFLVRVSGASDPGRYYLYFPATEQLLLCARQAPWIPSAAVSAAMPVACAAADGTPLTGTLTLPRAPRIQPPPLVVLCPDGPGLGPPEEFDREAQAFAGMGYAVLRVNYRGMGGLGLRHLEAIRGGLDAVPLDDILAAIDAVRQQRPIDAKRIAVIGEGFGGYLALRAVQVHPERFRCAIAISAPTDLRQWVREPDVIARSTEDADSKAEFQELMESQDTNMLPGRYRGGPTDQSKALNALNSMMGPHAENMPPPAALPVEDPPSLYAAKARFAFLGGQSPGWAAISPVNFPQDLIRPMLMIQDSTADPAYLASAGALRRAVDAHGGHVEFFTMDGALATLDPEPRAKVLIRIEDFLNLDFYSYNVEIGDLKTKD